MAKSGKKVVDRRKFLKSATAGGVATLLAGSGVAGATLPLTSPARPAPRSAPPPPMSREAETGTPPSHVDVLTTDRTGSDFMVDCFKSLNIEYVCSNPGSSFRGLHESVINYGGNKMPEFITCCHEESAVGMAHGYAKIEGKPLLVFAHGTVGLQHAAMAIYNAYCDRVPAIIVLGNISDATKRLSRVEWVHSVQDAASMVRDFTKWDDSPASLPHFAESAVRAYKIAMTPPMMPVVLVADGELQEGPIDNSPIHIPKLTLDSPPQGDPDAVAQLAKWLVAAENPVIVADRCARTPAGIKHLVDLAETLQAPVVDQTGRMNFPTRHPLNQSERSAALIRGADLVLGLELTDYFATIHVGRDQINRSFTAIARPEAKLVSITSGDLYTKGNYQDIQRYAELDMAIAGDAEATLPWLTEAVKRELTDDRKRTFQDRGKKLAEAHDVSLKQSREAATYGWDASPISTARLCSEVWGQIKNEDWSLVSDTYPWVSRWPQRLWAFEKHYQFIGGPGGHGVGYGAPAATGAALANKKYGRLTVNIQNDGDLMYAPGILWTAAHARIPILHVMHNNRAYHQESMLVGDMANRHNHRQEGPMKGTTITDPNIDYAMLAKGLGMYSEGPINDPKDLGPALARAVAVVKRGEPAMVDVVTQPR